MTHPAMIRDATPDDIPTIAAIWNPILRDTAISFWPGERSEQEVRDYVAERQKQGHAVLVAEEDGQVLGFASYAQFRAGGGYAHSMEHTIHLVPGARGKGLGRALMHAIEDHARARGARLMIGGITGSNVESLRFHERLGYAEWGRIPAAGRKFGEWHELVLMGLDLQA